MRSHVHGNDVVEYRLLVVEDVGAEGCRTSRLYRSLCSRRSDFSSSPISIPYSEPRFDRSFELSCCGSGSRLRGRRGDDGCTMTVSNCGFGDGLVSSLLLWWSRDSRFTLWSEGIRDPTE